MGLVNVRGAVGVRLAVVHQELTLVPELSVAEDLAEFEE